MTLRVNLGHTATVRITNEVLLVPEKLVVSFESDTYRLPLLSVRVRNGKREARYTVRGDALLDLTEFVFAGEIELSVSAVLHGDVVKRWHSVPVLVKEIDDEILVLDEIRDLQERVAALEESNNIIL